MPAFVLYVYLIDILYLSQFFFNLRGPDDEGSSDGVLHDLDMRVHIPEGDTPSGHVIGVGDGVDRGQ